MLKFLGSSIDLSMNIWQFVFATWMLSDVHGKACSN